MRFVVFGEDWGSHPSSTQHLFYHISERFNVTWFNSIGMRVPKLNSKDAKRVIKKLKLMAKLNMKNNKNIDEGHYLKVYNPFTLPWHNQFLVQKFNKFKINQHIDLSDSSPIIYWVSVATAIELIQLRPQDKLIYYCGDDFSCLAGVDHKMVSGFENKLVEKSDRIFVISEKLMRNMPPHKTQLLEHGVDFELFDKSTDLNKRLLDKSNVIGFYGSISEWLDIDLLIEISKQRPDYNIVLIGKSEIDLTKLLKCSNVYHFEAVDHSKLPSYSQHWQVSLLPFKINGQIKACDPLKLKEYLATGTPIVSTDFPAVRRFQDAVLIADDYQSFIYRLDLAMALNKAPLIAWKSFSKNLVIKHSWKFKADFVISQCRSM